MTVEFYGIRHHGPGSARAVARALAEFQPDLVLIEGPPEADALVEWVAAGLQPPVALLGYPVDDPRRAAYWPFAVFSPEWQALRHAVGRGVPARFFDAPFAVRAAAEPGPTRRPVDPIAELAAAAGYEDPERWWEDLVEHRLDGSGAFAAIGEAMAALRAEYPTGAEDLLREAYMRTALRDAGRTHERIAVVCGAWHVPALTGELPPAGRDAALLRGRPRAKVAFTWVPWTYGRLASWRGYGAGVTSPGWYDHLFTAPDEVLPRWLVAAAGVLRAEGLPVSSAHVIEAVRLAETLATLRGRPLAGLAEVTEAARSVLCDGDELRLEVIARRLVVGERLGSVPEGLPAVPLQRDLTAEQRRLRLKPEAVERDLDLDLRRDVDLSRSRLLHRLGLLGVTWGEVTGGRPGKGTFRESWRLRWLPEYAIEVVEASAYGTTVLDAATALLAEGAARAGTLAEVTALVESCLLAELPAAYPAVLSALDARAALDTDVLALMTALPALARTVRYGDVRGSDLGALHAVLGGLVTRIRVGLPSAALGLADDAAAELRDRVDEVHAALGLLDDAELTGRWLGCLIPLADADGLHGLLAGRLTRLLFEAGRLDADATRRRMALVLTVGVPPARAGAWIEGFLADGGLLLAHDEALLSLVDGWLVAIPPDSFTEVLPLLRRTFGAFTVPERRAIGERVAGGAGPRATTAVDLDHHGAARALPTLAALLGREVTDV